MAGIIAGIDYSLTSPAISIINTEKKDFFTDFSFHFFTTEKKQVDNKIHPQFNSTIYPKSFKDQLSRYDFLSSWTIKTLQKNSVDTVIMEGYSFGSKGSSLFQIAENAGILKYRISKELSDIELILVPPTVLKKFATGKGNANKDLMEEAFIKKTGHSQLKEILQQTKKMLNPSSDIIDSYFLCQYALSM